MPDDNIFNGNDTNETDETGDKPILVNRDHGIAAWINTDKDGNAYLSLSLPLGLGKVNLFTNNDDAVTEAMNKMNQYIKENR